MGTDRYAIQGGVAGADRLRLLWEVLGGYTRELIRTIGIPQGAVCFDVGCGTGEVTFELADVVGPRGRVVGIDLDEVALGIARNRAAEFRLANVEFEQHEVAVWKPDRSFDVAYVRFLLSHLSDPHVLLAELCRKLRPGGIVILEDIDYRGHFAEPECPALARAVDWYSHTVMKRGGDAQIGPRLPGLLREVGLQHVQMRLHHPAALEGGIKQLITSTLVSISEAVLADGLATPRVLRQTIEELSAFANDPHTVLGGPRIFQAWGRNSV